MRENIQLECTTCKKMRYTSTKNKRNTPDRLEFSKYCKFCRSHQPFRETK
ncbi:MAG: 50S ribosomal protein L33 [Nitrospinae bacterium]|nr:50S ribosomal protein L33 [Nitrospinota bacterium]MDE0340861.1 50S ribosomal protein L33 [Nitrospinota bacterium]